MGNRPPAQAHELTELIKYLPTLSSELYLSAFSKSWKFMNFSLNLMANFEINNKMTKELSCYQY